MGINTKKPVLTNEPRCPAAGTLSHQAAWCEQSEITKVLISGGISRLLTVLFLRLFTNFQGHFEP